MPAAPPEFPVAECDAATRAIDTLIQDLQRIATSHRDRVGDLTSWEGRGRARFGEDLQDRVDAVDRLTVQLASDRDGLGSQKRLHLIAVANWMEAQE